MSTPVSVEPPPKAHLRTGSQQEREFQQKIEQMIAMQYHEQNLAIGKLKGSSGLEPMVGNSMMMNMKSATSQPPLPLPPQQQQPQKAASKQFNRGSTGGSTGSNSVGANSNNTGTPWPSRTSTNIASETGVGTGTLLFSEEYQQSGTNPSIIAPPGYGAIIPEQEHLQQHLEQQQLLLHQQQQHDFHYGNPDYDREDEDDDGNKVSWCERCCCLCTPLLQLLRQEQLRRSFCYGAIDGTLTGSGIASAFCALGVLEIHTTWEVRLAVFCLSAAACFADSLCVAIGHIWTSYVVSSSHATDRAEERNILETSRGDAKAKLIDMLLARGVLKIDAMSLADTLEGYPDLFVNALVGDSLCAGPEEGELEDAQQRSDSRSRSNQSLRGLGSWNFPSYGQLEYNLSPEQANVDMVVKESQREGLFMMIGFATFATIPSLLWLFLPIWIEPSSDKKADTSGATISPSSMIVSITALIMWSLGAWKSSFLGSNSMMVGIETVIVLLICVLSAYGMGLLLKHSFGDNLELFVST
mmetsp:Transcript_14111/g.34195  ORF Transcript_14111/g.34195 Transcript_14111/m.34195 type:complete len:526 (-) Transcript_14111:119-1696(-)